MEAVLWPNGPVCPRCGTLDKIGDGRRHSRPRPGLYYCGHCKRQFTVTVGTIFERSKVPLTKWWLAIHLISSSKKGISSHQLYRMLGVTYQTAWFMLAPHPRGHEGWRLSSTARRRGQLIAQADETYLGPASQGRAQAEGRAERHAPDHGAG